MDEGIEYINKQLSKMGMSAEEVGKALKMILERIRQEEKNELDESK